MTGVMAAVNLPELVCNPVLGASVEAAHMADVAPVATLRPDAAHGVDGCIAKLFFAPDLTCDSMMRRRKACHSGDR